MLVNPIVNPNLKDCCLFCGALPLRKDGIYQRNADVFLDWYSTTGMITLTVDVQLFHNGLRTIFVF